MRNIEKHYELEGAKIEIDYSFYRREISPFLPEKILDFHTHTWSSDTWKELPWSTDKNGAQYMVMDRYYPPEKLLSDANACFPNHDYQAVVFGYPMPAADRECDTSYVSSSALIHKQLRPLMVAGPSLGLSREQYMKKLDEGGFYGFKVLLGWYGDDYGDMRIEDMLGPVERTVADERKLVILLHVPRRGRLTDPEVQAGLRRLALECPRSKIVLAHCGRCYMPFEMKAAAGCLKNLPNVWLDTAMVMDPVVIQIVLNELGPKRLLFGTDFPVAAMLGRRVGIKEHWVDVVSPGYPESAYRVAGDNFNAGFMAWEIASAIRWAAELAGINRSELNGIFYDNGMSLLT